MPILDIDDCSLYFEVTGSGSHVLLIHGATGDSTEYWSPVVSALKASHTVITYDQRGFGRSGSAPVIDVEQLASDAAALIRHVTGEPVAAVGASLGGLVAQQLAFSRPGPVDRLVLVGTAPSIGPRLRLIGKVLGEVAELRRPGLLFDINTILVYGEQELERHSEGLAAARTEFIAQGEAWFGKALADPPRWSGVDLALIPCPTLVVHGDEDAEMPLRYARELTAGLADARLLVLEGAGHKCFVEQPAEFAGALGEFLGGAWPPAALASTTRGDDDG